MESKWRWNAYRWGWITDGITLAARLLPPNQFYVAMAKDFPGSSIQLYFMPLDTDVPVFVAENSWSQRPHFPWVYHVEPDS